MSLSALQLLEDGNYFVNPEGLTLSSGNYEGAGTIFSYEKSTLYCPGQCILAIGPTDRPVNLMVSINAAKPAKPFNRDNRFKAAYTHNLTDTQTDKYIHHIHTCIDTQAHIITHRHIALGTISFSFLITEAVCCRCCPKGQTWASCTVSTSLSP